MFKNILKKVCSWYDLSAQSRGLCGECAQTAAAPRVPTGAEHTVINQVCPHSQMKKEKTKKKKRSETPEVAALGTRKQTVFLKDEAKK